MKAPLALGATHERSVFFAQLPAATSGVMSGVILGVGRAIGETMAVIMIAGNQPIMPRGLLEGLRTMTANVVLEMGYASGLHRRALIATGVVLFVFILIINTCFSLFETEGSEMKAMSEKHPDLSEKEEADGGGNHGFLRQQYVISWILTALVRLAAALAVLTVVILIGYILVTGVPHLSWDLFAWKYTTQKPVYDAGPGQHRLHDAAHPPGGGTHWRLCSHLPGGVCQTGQQAGKAGPSDRRDPFRDSLHCLWAVRLCIFNVACHWSFSMLAGSMTLAIMILPLILRTTEEALLSVPDSFREGSFGLGGAAADGIPGYPAFGYARILAGVILGVGRIVGESAALIFTSGSGTANLAIGKTGAFWKDLFAPLFQSTGPCRSTCITLMTEGLYVDQARATAVVLLVLVIGINALSALAAKRLTRGKGEA